MRLARTILPKAVAEPVVSLLLPRFQVPAAFVIEGWSGPGQRALTLRYWQLLLRKGCLFQVTLLP